MISTAKNKTVSSKAINKNAHFLLHAIRLHENTQSMSLFGAKRTSVFAAHMSAFDAVDGARSAASKCHRVVVQSKPTLRGAVHGRG
jgi:hypothetical protein